MTKAEVGYERWGAKEVMCKDWEDNSLYVRYENAILTLYTTKPPEGEQIDIIREKLKL